MTMNAESGTAVTTGVELDAAAERSGDGELSVRYTVTNGSDEAIVLLNFVQYPGDGTPDPDRAMVGQVADGAVRIVQRGWVDTPPSSIPPLHRMSLIEPGGSAQRRFVVALPSGEARAERVELGIGYVLADALDATVIGALRHGDEELRPVSAGLVDRQTMLYSAPLALG